MPVDVAAVTGILFLVVVALLVVPGRSSLESACPAGFIQGNGSCYHFNLTAQVDRHAAQSACVSRGATLVTIRDRVEQYFLESILGNLGSADLANAERYWIGLSDTDSENGYTWNDGTYALYTNWKCNTSRSGGSQACVTMENSNQSTTGRWDDATCTANMNGFICEIVNSTYPRAVEFEQGDCPDGWYQYDGQCYKFEITEKVQRYEALRACQNMSARLVTIDSDRIQNYIDNYFLQLNTTYDDAVWMGLHRQTHRSPWVWQDGSNLTVYSNWDCGETNNSIAQDKNCARIAYGSGVNSSQWSRASCPSEEANYICQQPITMSRNDPTPTTTPNAGPACKDGWVLWKGRCYKFEQNIRSSWEAAGGECLSMNASLVSIRDQEKQDFITAQLKQLTASDSSDAGFGSLWIGLEWRAREKAFNDWPDGSTALFRNFGCDVEIHGEPCAYVYYGTPDNSNVTIGQWGLASCRSQIYNQSVFKGYICETTLPSAESIMPSFPQGKCSEGWSEANGKCYYFPEEEANFTTAENNCSTMKASLVNVDSSDTNKLLLQFALLSNKPQGKHLPVWIGQEHLEPFSSKGRGSLSDTDSASVGSGESFENFGCDSRGLKILPAGHCVAYDFSTSELSSSSWSTRSCHAQYLYLCEGNEHSTHKERFQNRSKTSSTGFAVGLAVGLLGLCALIATLVYMNHRRQKGHNKVRPADLPMPDFFNQTGAVEEYLRKRDDEDQSDSVKMKSKLDMRTTGGTWVVNFNLDDDASCSVGSVGTGCSVLKQDDEEEEDKRAKEKEGKKDGKQMKREDRKEGMLSTV